MDIHEKAYIYSQVGGNLSIDFINTLGSYKSKNPLDHIKTYNDLVEWGRQMDALAAQEAEKLLEQASGLPKEAEAVLHRARELRQAIYAIFTATTEGRSSSEAWLDTLNAELSHALPYRTLSQADGGYIWTWQAAEVALDRMLWPVALAAADLLTGDKGQLERVRECAGDTCGWLFIDMSRNHSRHWCDMRDCGNRVKAQRHYQRKKALSAEAEAESKVES